MLYALRLWFLDMYQEAGVKVLQDFLLIVTLSATAAAPAAVWQVGKRR
jgi:hypothetical protein